jgi:uncharacterized protein involved in exopolysaccharide biosynthesis
MDGAGPAPGQVAGYPVVTIATDQAELDAVNAAIEAILVRGQASAIRDNSVTKADLATLYRRKDQLAARLARTARGGIGIRGAVPL